MIVANTNIVVAKKTFRRGQAVTGLSAMDKKWMLEAGYISETSDSSVEQKGRRTQKLEPGMPLASETGGG